MRDRRQSTPREPWRPFAEPGRGARSPGGPRGRPGAPARRARAARWHMQPRWGPIRRHSTSGCPEALEPDLPPEDGVVLGTEGQVFAGRGDVLEQDDGRRQLRQLTGALVDDPVQPGQHPVLLPAMADHVPIEPETPVPRVVVEGLLDLGKRLDPDSFP